MQFICYPKCSTCKKAKNWLDDNGIEYEERNIKESAPTYDELQNWYKSFEIPIRKLFNTSGILYRSMQLKDKLPAMSDEEMLRLLAADGMLVKRPVLVGDGFILIGFNNEKWKSALNL